MDLTEVEGPEYSLQSHHHPQLWQIWNPWLSQIHGQCNVLFLSIILVVPGFTCVDPFAELSNFLVSSNFLGARCRCYHVRVRSPLSAYLPYHLQMCICLQVVSGVG